MASPALAAPRWGRYSMGAIPKKFSKILKNSQKFQKSKT
jgi:hypothetical protein